MSRIPTPMIEYLWGRAYVDRRTVAQLMAVSRKTVEKRCRPHHYMADGRAMYDVIECEEVLRCVRGRARG